MPRGVFIRTAETRARLRAAGLGKTLSAETREKIRAKLIGRPRSPEIREKIRAAKMGKPRPDMKGRPPPNKGKPLSLETRRKISAAQLGKPAHGKGVRRDPAPWLGKKQSAETIAKRRLKLLGRLRPDLLGKRQSAESNAKRSAAMIGRPISAERRARLRKGPDHPWWGKRPKQYPRGRQIQYNGIMFKSSYEVRFAKAMDARSIAWEYEPRRFDLGSCTYLPDFYVPSTGAHWEIKGYFDEKSQAKIRLFRQLYADHPLIVATDDVLKMMEGAHRIAS